MSKGRTYVDTLREGHAEEALGVCAVRADFAPVCLPVVAFDDIANERVDVETVLSESLELFLFEDLWSFVAILSGVLSLENEACLNGAFVSTVC